MKIAYSEEAKYTLFEISDFIDSINTTGAGERCAGKFTRWVKDYAI